MQTVSYSFRMMSTMLGLCWPWACHGLKRGDKNLEPMVPMIPIGPVWKVRAAKA